MEQTCKKCKRIFPLSDVYFFKDKANKSGFKYTCKECLGNKFTKNKINNNAPEGYQRCFKCNEIKPATLDYFHKGNDTKYNLRNKCIPCRNENMKKYRIENTEKCLEREKKYREENREKCRMSSRRFYYNNKDNEEFKVKQDEWRKAWYENNKDEILKRRRLKYHNNREYEISKVRKYQKTPKGKLSIKINGQKRRSRKKSLPSRYTTKEWCECINFFKSSCCYCGTVLENPTQEHFIPISKGGEYTKDNILPACSFCNTSKNDTDFLEWYLNQEFYDEKRKEKIYAFLGYKDGIQQLTLI
ncbi:HNH endonuclease [Bacillus sp. S70]|uniref:HNH endonuclease n=1 Tax=unclassified Bacillus (in: firmicutes) TaxID=185979 RepID=UPI00190C3EF2|nr:MULTISPECIES: HNH endonuclease [unclassified Bacillus (in: firmicutes)]MBJ9983593.1 HNH endonuclease [Bacillus sp. S29]MBK0104746.1 HNH endonuclease [Bacillus sp. S70]MBK0110007.1 HNH endonuclease [Bacillus sp. S73]MBK0138873.1 HNH endonuclease [Bacillus sp. S72]MBK0147978.1 HNH endonuclease [Bacillus sp. S74]